MITMRTTVELKAPRLLLVSLLFLASAAFSAAHIGHFDDYWKEKAKNASHVAKRSSDPHPNAVIQGFDDDVANDIVETEETMNGINSTRRSLRGKKSGHGECMATNPIDRCWRCRKDWATDRKRLASCGKGFGRGAYGGRDGDFYTVTDGTDDDVVNPKEGTLRYGVIQEKPLWIIFAHDMIIRLTQELIITGDKTIDGRGANVRIARGAGLTIQFVKNVIIHNIHVEDIQSANGGMVRDSTSHYGLRTQSDGDGISIFGSSHVWLDHLSMSNCMDGMIDAIQGSTAITISNSHFTRHNDVMLFGASDKYEEDKLMQITVAFNHFGKGLVQRMPRCRWGFVHVVNNDYTHWLMYALGGSAHPTIISQGNRFVAPPIDGAKEVTHMNFATEDALMTWIWRSEGDALRNGATFQESGTKKAAKQAMEAFTRHDIIKAQPSDYVGRLTRYAGCLDCSPNRPC